jgi:GT2 family glycosyltransferase
MHDLAIIILNYNTRELLTGCLESLQHQPGLDYSVCVVDNCSTDGSADRVAERFPEVMLIRSPANDGYAAGNNLGLRAYGFPANGQARYAMLLNPDTLTPPGALANMVSFADAHPDLGVVGPKLMLMDGTLDAACRRSFPTPQRSFYRFIGLSKLFPRSRRFGSYNMTYLGIDEQAEVDSVVGACMLVRADAMCKAGLLDEQFFMYGEDLDWCLRIKEQRNEQGAPYRVMYYPGVTVQHVKRAASRHSPKAQYEFNRAMWLFYHKHYQAQTFFALDWLIRLGLALRGGRKLAQEVFFTAETQRKQR